MKPKITNASRKRTLSALETELLLAEREYRLLKMMGTPKDILDDYRRANDRLIQRIRETEEDNND